MPNRHPHPWRKDSLFGDGPRRPLDREQRARFRFLLNAHRRARRISPLGEQIGHAMARRLGVDGQLDPAHETIAGDVGCCSRTVRRALERLRALGLLMWQRRIARVGWRTAQTSNAYLLVPDGSAKPPAIGPRSCDGHFGRQTPREDLPPVIEVSPQARQEAREALARVATQRQAVLQARLQTKGRAATA